MLRSFLTLAALLPILLLKAQSPVTIQLQVFTNAVDSTVDIAHAGDDRLFLVSRKGVIRIADATGTVLPTPFLNIVNRVNSTGGEQGLLGLAFDPDYATNGFFYVHYVNGAGNGTNRISRFSVTANPNIADPNSEQILYTVPQPFTNHKGGDLDFGADGMLYAGFGDGGSANDPQNNGQNLANALGDIIRIDVSDPDTTYTVPPDNPFANVTNDTLPEIWASGLRNPWRFGFDALTGDLWIGDVGQNAYEEVDFWPAGDNSGANFGWRCYEGDHAFNTSGCQPASFYTSPVSEHPQAGEYCSVIGGRVYRGTAFWRLYGRYIYTDYCAGRFFSLVPDGNGGWTRIQLLDSGMFGLSCIGENSAGEMFTASVESGTVYRIVDPCPMAAPVITNTEDLLTSTPAVSYEWYLNGVVIPGAEGQSYTAVATGNYQVLASYAGGCELLSDSLFVSLVGVPSVNGTSLKVHPIPAGDKLTIEGLPGSAALLRFVDLAGRSALQQSIVRGGSRVVADVQQLVNGNYVLVICDADGNELMRQQVSVSR